MISALLLSALAFAAPDNFQVPAELGGGGGIRFTGSPVSHWDCGVCHDAAPEQALSVTATPDLFASGYVPGTTYALEISVGGAPLAAAFAAEAVSKAGRLEGQFSAAPALPPELSCDDGSDPVQLEASGQAAQSISCKKGLSTWRVSWTAPPDVGPVTLYVSAVVGNLDGSFTGDRATSRVLGIRSPSTPATSGCGGPLAALLALGVGLALWRRRGAALALLLLAPSLASAGDPGVDLSASAGAGIARMSLSGPAFGTPFWVQLVFPRAELSVRLHPTRFVEGTPLAGAFFEARYARGWAGLPSVYGGAFANPSDARLSLGYELAFGSFSLAASALYRVRMGGFEPNPLFDDVVYQGAGAQLDARQQLGPASLSIEALALAELDAGTLAARGYGRFAGGVTFGGRAAAECVLFGSGWAISLEYEYVATRAAFSGGGERLLGPVRRDDASQAIALRATYRR